MVSSHGNVGAFAGACCRTIQSLAMASWVFQDVTTGQGGISLTRSPQLLHSVRPLSKLLFDIKKDLYMQFPIVWSLKILSCLSMGKPLSAVEAVSEFGPNLRLLVPIQAIK